MAGPATASKFIGVLAMLVTSACMLSLQTEIRIRMQIEHKDVRSDNACLIDARA